MCCPRYDFFVGGQYGFTELLYMGFLTGARYGFPNWGKARERIKIATVRLDDIKEIKDLDNLKINIQGGELEVFRNCVKKLKDCFRDEILLVK